MKTTTKRTYENTTKMYYPNVPCTFADSYCSILSDASSGLPTVGEMIWGVSLHSSSIIAIECVPTILRTHNL